MTTAEKTIRGEGEANIESRIDEMFGEELSPAEQEVRGYLNSIKNADKAKCFDGENNLLPIRDWPEAERNALVRLTINPKTGNASIQFADPIKVSEQLAKLDGMYENTSESRDPFTKLLDGMPRPVLRMVMQEITRLAEREGIEAEQNGTVPMPEVSRETMAVETDLVAPQPVDVDPDADLDVV